MRKIRLKRWVRVVITMVVIHISFFIWKQTGILGALGQHDKFYLGLCLASWFYLTFGQALIYGVIWSK